jgi:hypothetical protein
MLAPMDLAAASAGPWLVLGVVVGVLLAGMLALAVVALRRARRSSDAPASEPGTAAPPDEAAGWTEDDLPGFLDSPPGTAPDRPPPVSGPAAQDVPLAAPDPAPAPVRRRIPAHSAAAATAAAAPAPSRVLLLLATGALVLVGIAAALAVLTAGDRSTETATAGSSPTESAGSPPTRDVPDLAAVPERPEPGDPGAGRLATVSVPIGDDGALVRLTFEGLVLERRAVGVTVAYPSVSLTAAEVPGGPALAHVRLPAWNCLSDTAPADPVAAGCRRLPTEYAELPTPALTVSDDGDGLRLRGRFPTYVRPGGSPPEWTGLVYPLAVDIRPEGQSATGTLHLGTERAATVDDPRLSDFRRGGG